MDGRNAPPPRASPSDRRITSGRPSDSAARCRLSSRTRWARTRVRSPSSEPPKRSNNSVETAKFSTASPRNSSRSLWSAPKLRCVSARSSNSAWANLYPSRCCRARSRASTGVVVSRSRKSDLPGTPFIFEKQEDRAHQFDFLVVSEADDHFVIDLGDLQVLGGDG